MTILHGDDRIYNNLIVQQYPVTDPEKTPQNPDYEAAGTAPFDIFPTYEEWIANFKLEDEEPDMGALAKWHFSHLPVWVDGNAYFNGASVCKHEQHYLACEKERAVVTLSERNGEYVLETNLYSLLGNFRDGLISSQTLGDAFEPEQRFENPDGSDILFDEDYYGTHRGIHACPGPIEPDEAGKTVFPLIRH